MSVSPGATLRELRAQKPLVHNITNYVVMNETANAILALGALPVMAHAREEVEEMVGLAGRMAGERSIPTVLDPVGAGATQYRTETVRRLLIEAAPAVVRGNAGEV